LSDLPEDVRRNQTAWNRMAPDYVEHGRRAWASDEPFWGIWSVPESELRVLPDVADMDVVELGCGTAYWSAWLARRGARPVGVDLAVDNRLVRDQFGMLRFEWPALGEEVEFHLAHGEMIQLLRSSAFEVEALIEVQAPEGESSGQWGFVTLEWARRWEEIWQARKG
jgi:SAM-dependent methyltransferase